MTHTRMQNHTHQFQPAYSVFFFCIFIDLLLFLCIHVCNHIIFTACICSFECIIFKYDSYEIYYSLFLFLMFIVILRLTPSAFTNKIKRFLWLHQHLPAELCTE